MTARTVHRRAQDRAQLLAGRAQLRRPTTWTPITERAAAAYRRKLLHPQQALTSTENLERSRQALAEMLGPV